MRALLTSVLFFSGIGFVLADEFDTKISYNYEAKAGRPAFSRDGVPAKFTLMGKGDNTPRFAINAGKLNMPTRPMPGDKIVDDDGAVWAVTKDAAPGSSTTFYVYVKLEKPAPKKD